VIAVAITGEGRTVSRFPGRDHFAAYSTEHRTRITGPSEPGRI